MAGVRIDAEIRLQQKERHAGGPGLRLAGNGIRYRVRRPGARESGEDFRKAVVRKGQTGVIELVGDDLRLTVESVAAQPHDEKRHVMRPDRAEMVPHGVVTAFLVGDASYPPARQQIRALESRDHALRRLLVDDAGPQGVAGVRRDRLDRSLLTVEREGEKLLVLEPEVAVESVA